MKHRLPLRTPEEKARAKAWIDKAPIGWSVEFRAPVRSTDQNRRLWAFLDDIAAQKEWEGKKRSSEAWKDLFSAALKTQEIVRGLEGGIVALAAGPDRWLVAGALFRQCVRDHRHCGYRLYCLLRSGAQKPRPHPRLGGTAS